MQFTKISFNKCEYFTFGFANKKEKFEGLSLFYFVYFESFLQQLFRFI